MKGGEKYERTKTVIELQRKEDQMDKWFHLMNLFYRK